MDRIDVCGTGGGLLGLDGGTVMLLVLTIIFGGQFYQEEASDPVTCFVVRAHAVSSGATYAKCEVIRYVAA